jgi:sugar-phosphatase
MKKNTAIFDMDGLLIDSEPLWHEAAREVMLGMGVDMDEATYATTVGLRTREFLEHWFAVYGIRDVSIVDTDVDITRRVIEKVRKNGVLMPGVREALSLLKDKGIRIGLATSSPRSLITAMIETTGLQEVFEAITSAEHLAYGKPHPQVYLDCAELLGVHPTKCVCFEDSFNGMIAAKAARMKCVVVPEASVRNLKVWEAADRKLSDLTEFTEEVWHSI